MPYRLNKQIKFKNRSLQQPRVGLVGQSGPSGPSSTSRLISNRQRQEPLKLLQQQLELPRQLQQLQQRRQQQQLLHRPSTPIDLEAWRDVILQSAKNHVSFFLMLAPVSFILTLNCNVERYYTFILLCLQQN